MEQGHTTAVGGGREAGGRRQLETEAAAVPGKRRVCYSGQRAAWGQSKEMSWASLPCAGGPCTGGCWATGGCCWGGPPEGAIWGGHRPSVLLPQARAPHPLATSLEHSIAARCLVLSPVSPGLPREASLQPEVGSLSASCPAGAGQPRGFLAVYG